MSEKIFGGWCNVVLIENEENLSNILKKMKNTPKQEYHIKINLRKTKVGIVLKCSKQLISLSIVYYMADSDDPQFYLPRN